jgi:hypothetical protein
MGTCIVSIFQYISNKMQRYTVYLYPETALHISGGTSTHHQERIQLYLQHLWQIPDAVDTVVCASYDGWKYHPKHVEQFPDINKLCNVASCWIYEYIGILLGAHPILHISIIRVNGMRYVFEVCLWQNWGLIFVVSWMKISSSLLDFLLTWNVCLLFGIVSWFLREGVCGWNMCYNCTAAVDFWVC